MEAVTAVGLASSVITFVAVGSKLARRLKELSEAGDVPEVFGDIHRRVSLVESRSRNMQHEFESLSPEARAELKEIVEQCTKQSGQLAEILKKVQVSKGDSRLQKVIKAGISMAEEGRVQRIATMLRDNIQLLTLLSVTPTVEGRRAEVKHPSPELLHTSTRATGLFDRDESFVGRAEILHSITTTMEKQSRAAISGIGGVGKSQIAIEYCYRYMERKTDAQVFWVYGGSIARFYEGYKRIAKKLELPGWDDPGESVLELVHTRLSNIADSYLLVIDNADDIEHWWPGKYKSGSLLDDPTRDLSKYLPERSRNGHLLITTRDSRVAKRLAMQMDPIVIDSMSEEEAKSLFLSKFGHGAWYFDKADLHHLMGELGYLPLAVTQAASFIQENHCSIIEYVNALRGEDPEKFLDEELDDCRRDRESVNCVFRTWKLSYDIIKRQKPQAAELLNLLAMLDNQSIPKSLLKVPEVTTSLGVLLSFHLVKSQAGSQRFQIHRLVQRFVKLSLLGDDATQIWQEKALACVSKDYPTEIGVAEGPICDALAPHVHVVTQYKYETKASQLDLAHLLCWAADFDIERGMYNQASERAEESRKIFSELVAEKDERLAAATWLCGRLRYYRAQSASDLGMAEQLLRKALRISIYPSLNYAESAFELAHIYYDQCSASACLEMGKASFECWKDLEGPNSVRTLDNMHDYALELALLGKVEDGIAYWQEMLDRCPVSDACVTTRTIFTYRSKAAIAEFQGDAGTAEKLYCKLIAICEAIYYPEHIHIFDYQLSHAEQIMRQGRLDEATRLSESILARCKNTAERCIRASCLQILAECCRQQNRFSEELTYRQRTLTLHESNLGSNYKETADAKEALADCQLHSGRHAEAQHLYQEVLTWRNNELGGKHIDTLRAIECLGISYANQGQDAEAEIAFLDAVERQSDPDTRLLDNVYLSFLKQGKWEMLESWSRRFLKPHDVSQPGAHQTLITVLERQGKTEEAMSVRAGLLELEASGGSPLESLLSLKCPPARDDRRFGRMIHPRTWSA